MIITDRQELTFELNQLFVRNICSSDKLYVSTSISNLYQEFDYLNYEQICITILRFAESLISEDDLIQVGLTSSSEKLTISQLALTYFLENKRRERKFITDSAIDEVFEVSLKCEDEVITSVNTKRLILEFINSTIMRLTLKHFGSTVYIKARKINELDLSDYMTIQEYELKGGLVK